MNLHPLPHRLRLVALGAMLSAPLLASAIGQGDKGSFAAGSHAAAVRWSGPSIPIDGGDLPTGDDVNDRDAYGGHEERRHHFQWHRGEGSSPDTLPRFGAAGHGDSRDRSLTVSPVPEPGTYALMLAGLGVLGFVARRRRRD